jgi:hypothetical protein
VVDVLIEIERVHELHFSDGHPVRGASAIVPFGDGWLVAQDDSAHACWWREDGTHRVQAHPSISGLDLFDSASGTKHLKPDIEAACRIEGLEAPHAVLLLGSGSRPARMSSALVTFDGTEPASHTADLTGLYTAVAEALEIPLEMLNLEGVCIVEGTLRWFQRGLPSAGWSTASVDLDLVAVLSAARGGADPGAVPVGTIRRYDLGSVADVGLAVTDAVTLGGQQVLVSAAAEDTPNVYDDGPVVGSALAILDGEQVLDLGLVPAVDGQVQKVEGLAVVEWGEDGGHLLATVDQDDHTRPSLALDLRVSR